MNEIVTELLHRLDEDLILNFTKAGILEFDAGYDRNQAEQLSLLYLLKTYPVETFSSQYVEYARQRSKAGVIRST